MCIDRSKETNHCLENFSLLNDEAKIKEKKKKKNNLVLDLIFAQIHKNLMKSQIMQVQFWIKSTNSGSSTSDVRTNSRKSHKSSVSWFAR